MSSEAGPPVNVLWSINPGPFPLTARKTDWDEFVNVLWSMRYADDEVFPLTLISVFGGLDELPVNVNPVIRDSQEPEGSSVKAGEAVTITRPWPLIVRHLELGISIAPPNETVPAGTMIVSPLEATLIHA